MPKKQRHREDIVPAVPSRHRPPLILMCGVALASFAVLGYEVALTRVFAVLLRYHFAFLVISIALCGLGIGGYLAHWLRQRRQLSLPLLALGFSLGILVSLLLILRVVFAAFPTAYWLAALLVLAPFTCAGAFLAEAFTRYAAWSGWLYAWDLIGAALAAVGIVALLQVFSAINVCLLIAVLGGIAGMLTFESTPTTATRGKPLRHTTERTSTLAWCVVFLAIFLVNLAIPIFDIPPIPPRYDAQRASLADQGLTQPLFTELGDPSHRSKIIETRWNAFARTDVVAEFPDFYYLYTNGNVPTMMLRWDGNDRTIAPLTAQFTLSDWAFACAPLGRDGRKQGAVFSIGPGGGLDALLAVQYGAERCEGAELNASIMALMAKYRDYNGRIYEHPDVHVVTAEGRAYLREQVARGRRYALIFSALTKTATASQGMALLESYIHTEDAVADYLSALQPDGQLVWLVDNPLLLTRFFTTAVSVLQRHGVSTVDACRRIVLAFDPKPGPYQYALVLQQTPFTPAQTTAITLAAQQRGLHADWVPQFSEAMATAYGALRRGDIPLSQFIATSRTLPTPQDIAPCHDNRPFVLDTSIGIQPVFQQLAVFALVLALVLAVMGWRGAARASVSERADALFIPYFLALGIGFMLVEIPLMQKLILPLGYPTLALTVILFSLLLGGGLGSWFSQRIAGNALKWWAGGAMAGIAALTVLSIILLPWLNDRLIGIDIVRRCLIMVMLLLPLGFLLGTPFPSGMRLFAGMRGDHVALLWGVNGVASVVGSLCAAMGAKIWGFNAMLAVGAGVYLFGMLILLTRRVAVDRPVLP